MTTPRRFRLFVYGTLLPGEADHELLQGAELVGPATTKASYKLVELNASAGLIDHGDTAIVGELYDVDVDALARCDVKREHPVLYERRAVELDDGQLAHAYFLRIDQVRGLRRVRGGDWRARFKAQRAGPDPAYAKWARSRYRR